MSSDDDEKVIPVLIEDMDSERDRGGGDGSRPADAFAPVVSSLLMLLSALHVDGGAEAVDDESDNAFVLGSADVDAARGGFLLWSCVLLLVPLGRFMVATWWWSYESW